MEGDLSLSRSLGGLRIANPDDSPLNSFLGGETPGLTSTIPSALIPQSQEAIGGTSLSLASLISSSEDIVSNCEDAYGTPAASVTPRVADHVPQRQHNRSSVLYAHQDSQLTSQISNQHGHVARPASGLYTQPFAANLPTTIAPRESSYRIWTEPGGSSLSEMTSQDSKGRTSVPQDGVSSRDHIHSDRSYKLTQFSPGNAPLPLRQSSRPLGHSIGIPQPTGSPYTVENGGPISGDDWQERGAAVGVRQEVDVNGKSVSRYIKKGVRDFSFGHVLGEGSYSTVVLATDRQTLNEYAIKILDKRHIIKEKKVKYVNIEKDTLNRLTDHPGIVRLYYTFQDDRSLYFVLDLCKGGELLGVLKRMSTFDEECTKFYGAQILDTIDYMHRRGVIHRDLKPENILLDSQMHTKITDFGTAKILKTQKRVEDGSNGMLPLDSMDIPKEDRANSFVGTAEYVSPELLTDKNACKASDLWAFGCIIFQLLAGRPPFKASNEYLTFQKIVALDYEFPTGFPAVARDLVERLLVLDPARRLPIEHIKNHEFFDGISWGRGLWKLKAPRLKSYVPPREPIKLNGTSGDSISPNLPSAAPSTTADINARAFPRLITELPPPSQLDIEWSPVLSKSNERILKLGNLIVLSSPAPHSPSSRNGDNDTPKKFSRFFGGTTTRKRQRLVIVTSSARIILAAAGGEEKKVKLEIPLLTSGTHYRSTTDSKGFAFWFVDTRDKHFVFEDPKSISTNAAATAVSAQEWLDTLDRAKEMALSQQGGVYSSDEAFRDMSSGLSSHANTFDHSSEFHGEGSPAGRSTLIKHPNTDTESVKGKKRFSRRHSKNGLAAVF